MIPRNLRKFESSSIKKHIIVAAICRIDFNPLFAFDSLKNEFQKKFSANFPIAEIESISDFEIDSTKLEAPIPVVRNKGNVESYVLRNPDRQAKLKFSKDSLIIEQGKYTTFEDFTSAILSVYEFIEKSVGEALVVKRVGIRKLNQHIVNDQPLKTAFDGFFNSALISQLKSDICVDNLVIGKHCLQFKIDSFDLILNYGTDSGYVSENNNIALKKRFYVDIDCFFTEKVSSIKHLKTILSDMNDVIFDVFWWSTDEKLRELMRKGDT